MNSDAESESEADDEPELSDETWPSSTSEDGCWLVEAGVVDEGGGASDEGAEVEVGAGSEVAGI